MDDKAVLASRRILDLNTGLPLYYMEEMFLRNMTWRERYTIKAVIVLKI